MTEGFHELGLSSALVNALEALGLSRPTAIQRAAIPVLRRGGNAVLHAGSGAGATAAYGLALADRLSEGGDQNEPAQILVVTPTEEQAGTIALELGRIGRAVGLRAGVPGPGWRGDASALVVPIARAVALLQSSSLKLDQLKAVVVHDLSSMLSLSEESALETLLSTVPRDTQRIIVTSELSPAIEKLADAHARKALHVPGRPADRGEAPPPEPAVTLEYRVVQGPAMLAQAAQLAASGKGATVFCRNRPAADQAAAELSLRGIKVDLRVYGESGGGGTIVGCGSPFDAETLASAFGAGGVVLVEARELPHLRTIAKQANVRLKPKVESTGEASGLDAFRGQIRCALTEEDVDAQLLVLAPLLQEYSAAEIAGALSALLRKRSPQQQPPPPASSPRAGVAFVKLFLSVGTRDGIATRELVGAITGEAGVSGDQLGKIEVRDTFSIVEITADAADKVIRALNGTSLRGRSLRVDFDRKREAPRKSAGARRPRPS